MDDPWVMVAARPGERYENLKNAWELVRNRTGLHDVRIHNLRHLFASRALALRERLPMIGTLLCHGKIHTTARYAHLTRDSVNTTEVQVAESIRADIEGPTGREHSGTPTPTA